MMRVRSPYRQTINGEIRSPGDGERYFALQKITSVFEKDIDKNRHTPLDTHPFYPREKIVLETNERNVTMIMDLLVRRNGSERSIVARLEPKTVLLQILHIPSQGILMFSLLPSH